MGCHFLLQRVFLTQGSNPGLLHCRLILYLLSHSGNPKTLLLPLQTVPLSKCLQVNQGEHALCATKTLFNMVCGSSDTSTSLAVQLCRLVDDHHSFMTQGWGVWLCHSAHEANRDKLNSWRLWHKRQICMSRSWAVSSSITMGFFCFVFSLVWTLTSLLNCDLSVYSLRWGLNAELVGSTLEISWLKHLLHFKHCSQQPTQALTLVRLHLWVPDLLPL